MSIRCSQCQTENPDNGSFCIECGSPLRAVAIGSTERLPDPAGTKQCATCGTLNPSHAVFCVNCGRSLEAPTEARPVATAAPPQIRLPEPPAELSLPTQPVLSAPKTVPVKKNFGASGGMIGGIFLIGLAILAVTGWWWPGILVLLAINAYLGAAAAGETRGGVIGAFWLLGLAALAITGWWWPGILVLLGLTAFIGSSYRPRKKGQQSEI